MEFGVGIHGEPGRFREKIDYSTGTFCDDLSRRIVTDLEEDLALKSGEEVAVFGGTPYDWFWVGDGPGGGGKSPYKGRFSGGLKKKRGIKKKEKLVKK